MRAARAAAFVAAVLPVAPAAIGPAQAQVGCTYDGCPREEVLSTADEARIAAVLRAIAGEVAHAVDERLDVAVVPKAWVVNARAYRRDGAPEIGYNALWMLATLDGPDEGRWPLRALVAHEMAHHLLGHTAGGSADRHTAELEADAFAGAVLHVLGATRHEAQALWRGLPERGSETHPAAALRRIAVARGWDTARAGGTAAEAAAMAATLAR